MDNKTHELKTWPAYFQAVKDGRKTFELRKHDRNFKVGDLLLLKEYVPNPLPVEGDYNGEYTGEELRVQVTFILPPLEGLKFGIAQNYCLMGITTPTQDIETRAIYDAIESIKSSLNKLNEQTWDTYGEQISIEISNIERYLAGAQSTSGALEAYGKLVLSSIAETFANPDNQGKADLETDKHVFKAVGDTIKNFPLPDIGSFLANSGASSIQKSLQECKDEVANFYRGVEFHEMSPPDQLEFWPEAAERALASSSIQRQGEGVELIEKAIDDTFNMVYYSMLHPETFEGVEHNKWRENWIKNNVPTPTSGEAGREAVEFANWIKKSGYKPFVPGNEEQKNDEPLWLIPGHSIRRTSEQLYQIFISKQGNNG